MSKTMQFKVGVVNRSGCFFSCTMCPAFIQPDLSAACETPVLHGSQNLLEKSTQELFGSFTLHVLILFLLGFSWDGHFRP